MKQLFFCLLIPLFSLSQEKKQAFSGNFNLGLNFNLKYPFDLLNDLNILASTSDNLILLKIFDYINDNEKELFIYNLDKKFFCLNLFVPLEKNYE